MFAAAEINQQAGAQEGASKVSGQQVASRRQLRFKLTALLASSMLITIVMTMFVIQAECASLLKLRRASAVAAPLYGELDGGENVAQSLQQQQQPQMISRVRREANSSAANKLQQLEQLNEQTMKSQLPDWIAQAHKDKSVERALLRMLISASLRSNLGGSGGASANTRPLPASWQLDGGEGALLDGGLETLPAAHSARLEQATAAASPAQEFSQTGSALDGVDLGTLVATINQLNTAQLQPLDQGLYPMMDKREYIKPCSFNAISCVRTPFRKL